MFLNAFKNYLLAIGFIFFIAFPALAQQDDDVPSVYPITYDQVIEDTITNTAIFDWWQLEASQGDIIVADMEASNGLAPLLGILDPSGSLVACSGGIISPEGEPQGCGSDGEVDGKITLEYTALSSGQHTIVATRVGNMDGTTTGNYTLLVQRASSIPPRVNPFQEVVFRCQDFEAVTVATLKFADDPETVSYYRINVYGLGDFKPVIRVHLSLPDVEDCSSDPTSTEGIQYLFPDAEPITLENGESPSTAQLLLTGADRMGTITLTIGSKDGAPGRYMAVIDGFTIDPANDADAVEARIGPLATAQPIQLYMVAVGNSRVDPTMSFVGDNIANSFVCDDAGRRGCEGVPAIDGTGAVLNDGLRIIGDPFDAGMLFNPGNPDPLSVDLGSFSTNTDGDYALVIMGELPPRE